MLSLVLILVLLLIFPEALCASILKCTILVGQLNKIFGLITQTIKSLHGLYCMVFKICDFGVTLSPSLHQVFMEAAKKSPASMILSRFGSTCLKHENVLSS